MYCTHCGVQNADDANFCSSCGKETSSRSTETVEHRTDEPQQQVQVHHPWMSAQQPPQEQSRQQVQEEAPSRSKSVLSRIRGWSKKKKILAGIAVFFFFVICTNIMMGPAEEDADGKSMSPPKELIETSEWWADFDAREVKVPEYAWYDAEEHCENGASRYSEYSQNEFDEVIEEAVIVSQKLDISMPSDAEIDNLQAVYTGTLTSSDTWANAFHANEKLHKMFLKASGQVTREKFGRGITVVELKDWLSKDKNSPESVLVRRYERYEFTLQHWFRCGTASIQQKS